MRTDTQALYRAIVHAMRNDGGLNVTIEYPGFLALNETRGAWSMGTANGTWAGDFTSERGDIIATFDTALSADTTDASVIARALVFGVLGIPPHGEVTCAHNDWKLREGGIAYCGTCGYTPTEQDGY